MNKFRQRRIALAAGLLMLSSASAVPAQSAVAPAPLAAPQAGPAAESPVEGLTRHDDDTVVLALPGGNSLQLHDFDWNGQIVRTNKVHFRQTIAGVVEITSKAANVGEWHFHIRDAANYYGFGERSDALNHAHQFVRNAMVSSAAAVGGSSTKPMPFFMSTTGYGLWVDATSEATFDMNASDPQDIIVTVPVDRLRIVLFPGPDFAGILQRFTRLMGPVTLPPYWAFAPWKARANDEETQAQVLSDEEKLRELKLPAGVMLLDDPWSSQGNYSFDTKRFPDVAALSQSVHDAGFKIVAGVSPWVAREDGENPNDPYFIKRAEAGIFIRTVGKTKSSPVDLTSVSSRTWWQTGLRDAMKAGVDGFYLRDIAGGFGDAVHFYDASDARLMRNRFAMLAEGAAGEVIDKDMKSDGAVLMENASQGATAPGFVLAHNHVASLNPETGLPTLVNAALSAGMSGMPLWTMEMGQGRADSNTFLRWAEFACFSPVMITTQGPWEFDETTFEIYRKYAALHMSLFPYRYAAAVEAAKTGMPVMRALVLEYQNDERARTARDEYMFGHDLLVAPALDDSPERPVYLPEGAWINYWTGTQVVGGKSVMAESPLGMIPVYARMGAVIPKVTEDVQTLTQVSGSEARLHSLDGKRVYELVGPSASGEVGITDFEGRKVVRSGNTLKFSEGPAARVILRWRFAPVRSVVVNGASVSLQSGQDGSYAEFDYADAATVTWE